MIRSSRNYTLLGNGRYGRYSFVIVEDKDRNMVHDANSGNRVVTVLMGISALVFYIIAARVSLVCLKHHLFFDELHLD